MLSEVAKKMTGSLLKRGAIQSSEQDVIKYALELLISTLSYLFSIVVISLIIGKPFFSILFILSFMPIRAFCGGYHCSTYLMCFIVTNLLFIANLTLALITPEHVQAGLILPLTLVSFIGIFVSLPVINPKNPLSQKRIRRDRKVGRIVLTGEVLCIFVGRMLGYATQEFYLASLSLFTAFVLMLIPLVFFQHRRV